MMPERTLSLSPVEVRKLAVTVLALPTVFALGRPSEGMLARYEWVEQRVDDPFAWAREVY